MTTSLGLTTLLRLTFSRGSETKLKGPYPVLRFEGEVMRAEVGGPVIARHVEHAWEVDGLDYPRLQCDGDATLHFERIDGSRSKQYGPFQTVSFIDGVAYADHRIFAFADRSIVDWYCHEDGEHWPLMVVTAAD
jgi:hypothetical protein